jgi:hypothetical protein
MTPLVSSLRGIAGEAVEDRWPPAGDAKERPTKRLTLTLRQEAKRASLQQQLLRAQFRLPPQSLE